MVITGYLEKIIYALLFHTILKDKAKKTVVFTVTLV